MTITKRDSYNTTFWGKVPGDSERRFLLDLSRKQTSMDDTREIVCVELTTTGEDDNEDPHCHFYLLKSEMKQIAEELLRLSEMPPVTVWA